MQLLVLYINYAAVATNSCTYESKQIRVEMAKR